MPKKNQVKGYATQALAGGRTGHYWKPTPKERREGWKTLTFEAELHESEDALEARAIAGCLERNRAIKAAREGRAEAVPSALRVRRPRWRDARRAFKASDAFQSFDGRPPRLSPKTQIEYNSRLKMLDAWALDGELLLADLDRRMILDLRKALVQGSLYRASALLRVLSLFLQFCEDEGLIAVNPARKLKIPSPPKRTRRVFRDQVPVLVAAAEQLGHAHVALGIVLGFYSMQREADLLGATGFQIRAVDDVSSDARRALSGPDGKVSGLWLQQEKTDAWVAVSLAPQAREAVAAAVAADRARGAACTNLILHPEGDGPCPDWRFQRDFRETVTFATKEATERQDHDLARLLEGDPEKKRDAIQFRDLRRSGMCWLRELHVPVPLIASISGHSIQETQKILDTYMPRDTRAAAEGMAIAVARQAERDAEDALEQEQAE